MTLLRRAPREVYRVYSEAEFFDGAVAGMELFKSASAPGLRDRRLRRFAGAAMLAGAVGTMVGAVVLADSRPPRGSGRRAGGEDAHAFARVRLSTRTDVVIAHNGAAGGSDGATSPSVIRRTRFGDRARVRAGRTAFATAASHRPRFAPHARIEHAERAGYGEDAQGNAVAQTVDAASGSAPVPATSDGASTSLPEASDGAPAPVPAVATAEAPAPVPAAAHSSAPSTTATSPPPAAPSAQRAEFGFER
jgi:hypothetical protein